MISDQALDRAWASWCAVWNVGTRQKGGYKMALRDLDDHQFTEAARAALTDCRYFPTPYEIKQLAPPPRSKYTERKSTQHGWTQPDLADTGYLKRYKRTCEEWFRAIQDAEASGVLVSPQTATEAMINRDERVYLALMKKKVAVQHILVTRELRKREALEHDTDPNVNGDSRVPHMESGVLGLEREEEVRPVGVRCDRGESGQPPHVGPDDIPLGDFYETEEDATGDTTVVLDSDGREGSDPRVELGGCDERSHESGVQSAEGEDR